jgi:hypothetical protein
VLVWIGPPTFFGNFQFDEGIPGVSRATTPEYSSEWFEAVRESGRNNVSVYVIDALAASGGRDSGGGSDPSDGAGGFTDGTGGQSFTHYVNAERAVKSVWQDAGSYYLLGYAAPADDHRLHKIDVRVKRPNVTIRARKLRG